ncbi:hypothetical protein SAMN05414137_12017 [Streptacidiphilus jiangxiensis]|uniref:Uncharacterized protein n=1 Tax=Streptacidiphilus jiangxiensis TaxID=235985 RepID=A0A1H7W9H8_STRJI|nr:hypothetical protein SAMN05414137_12017 [Streptacidiphilus jiangxiensis]
MLAHPLEMGLKLRSQDSCLGADAIQIGRGGISLCRPKLCRQPKAMPKGITLDLLFAELAGPAPARDRLVGSRLASR